jgi:hypothetical protein
VRLGRTQRLFAGEAAIPGDQLSRAEIENPPAGDGGDNRRDQEKYEHRYGVDEPGQLVSVIELPDGRMVRITRSLPPVDGPMTADQLSSPDAGSPVS